VLNVDLEIDRVEYNDRYGSKIDWLNRLSRLDSQPPYIPC